MNEPEPTPTLAGKTVVTVEDEGVTQLQLRRALPRYGLRLIGQAQNGAEGVEMVLREHPDLVLMDVNMPVMDGLEATQQIMQQWDACILIVTAYTDETTRQRAQEAGAQGVFAKPIIFMDLLTRMEQVYAAHCAVSEHERCPMSETE